ncbi:hypothetical protein [Paenibacillus sp. N3.4]|uniref:hypothetical protein n=1 Tax=Paenibacillus sp. N3.4 TaxID=2603222 RepID=UPI00164EE6BB|nr:hypothetical protein [Paenibacillus sp. N3.4]
MGPLQASAIDPVKFGIYAGTNGTPGFESVATSRINYLAPLASKRFRIFSLLEYLHSN